MFPLLLLQQTIGHATAMRYPKQQSSIVQRKVAGQAGAVGHPGSVHLVSSNIQTVKVVEWTLQEAKIQWKKGRNQGRGGGAAIHARWSVVWDNHSDNDRVTQKSRAV